MYVFPTKPTQTQDQIADKPNSPLPTDKQDRDRLGRLGQQAYSSSSETKDLQATFDASTAVCMYAPVRECKSDTAAAIIETAPASSYNPCQVA